MVSNDPYQTFAIKFVSGYDLFRVFVKIGYACTVLCTMSFNGNLGEQAGPTLTTFKTIAQTSVWLPPSTTTLCNIIKQDKLVISWCVCVCVSLLSLAEKKQNILP